MASTEMRRLQSGLSMRLSVIGIPSYSVNPFTDLLHKWITCSGEEWTVKRCKSLKLTLIQLRSKTPVTTPLARNRHGEFKGIIGSLIRWALKSDKNFSKVLNAFMAYTYWTSSKLTSSQRKKFLSAINANPVAISGTVVHSLARMTAAVIGRRTIRENPQPLIAWRGSRDKRAPTLNDGSVKQSDKLLSEIKLTRNLPTFGHVFTLWDDIYCHVFKGLDILKRHAFAWSDKSFKTDHDSGMLAGEVHFIQEPGYKLRSIASPFRLFQVASEPLKNDLGRLVRSLDWDCTHDQGKAIQFIQAHLKERKTVYSVDLSSATDMFPYELQEIVLETIYGRTNPYVRLFRDVSRSNWRSELGVMSWKKGQPLGFGPSFFTFTLTHGLVLLTLMGGKYNNEFFVLGDDVVILDERLFTKYTAFLDEMNCPYAKEKSIVSNELAEFAGKVVTSDSVYPQLKWRKVSDDNFLDLARNIGPRIRLLLSKKQRQILDVFAHIPGFVHPYGLNWSYPGSNLEKMIKTGLELSFKERVLDSLTGLSESVNSQVYTWLGSSTNDLLAYVDKTQVKEVVSAFDEKVVSAFLKIGYARRHYEHFLENLKDVPQALCSESNRCELPFAEKPPSRVTLKQRLSRFITMVIKP